MAKASICIFSRDTNGDNVSFGPGFPLQLVCIRIYHVKIDLRGCIWCNTIKLANRPDAMEWNTNLQLSSRKVDPGYHFRGSLVGCSTCRREFNPRK